MFGHIAQMSWPTKKQNTARKMKQAFLLVAKNNLLALHTYHTLLCIIYTEQKTSPALQPIIAASRQKHKWSKCIKMQQFFKFQSYKQ